jgi:parallel beta-helix repeat protein
LTSALSSAQSGDTILLGAGSYSAVNLKDLKFDGLVTIASKDPNDPAVLTGLSISGSEGLKFSNLEFDLSSPHTVWNLSIAKSKNIELNGLDIHGSLNNNPGDDRSAVLVRGSSDVRVLNSEFQQLDHAISLAANNGVRVEGNTFHDIRADGVIGSGSSNVQVVGNTFTDFYPVGGDHPDAIQFFTTNTTASARDITISGNLITRGDGGIIQGIFVTDQVGNLPYQNVTITDNVVVGAMYNGIAVHNSKDLTVSGNTVASYGDMKSWIYVFKSTGATVTDNEAMVLKYGEAIGLVQSGNKILPAISDQGAQLINAWIRENEDGAAQLPEAPPPAASAPEPAPGSSESPLATIKGSSGDDSLHVSGAGGVRIEAGGGNDVLFGGSGKNALVGGAGNDTYYISDLDDQVIEGTNSGYDVVYASVDHVLAANVEVLKMLGGATAVSGNGLDNRILGTGQGDEIQGLGGSDYIMAGNGADTLDGGAGNDQLLGEGGGDRMDGGVGNDTLSAAAGADTLIGGDGSDRLDGGAGADVLTGGAGADSFLFRPGQFTGGVDSITDFSSAQGDRMMLSEIDANSRTAANDKFAFIGKAEFHGQPGELRYEVVGRDAIVSGDTNGDSVADFHIKLVGVTTVIGSDFAL